MIEHVVEREEASQEHFPGGDPPVADVLGAERTVDAAPVDPASTPSHSLPMSVGVQ